jgi:predicted RNase H-like HicB family nuclease
LERDEDGYYVVECPSLPGCLSHGKTPDEAMANIREAIEGKIDLRRRKELTAANG